MKRRKSVGGGVTHEQPAEQTRGTVPLKALLWPEEKGGGKNKMQIARVVDCQPE